MKKTIEGIRNGLEFLTESKIESLDVKINELKESFIDEQIKSFNIDLSNKVATQTISNFMVGVEFSNSMKEDINKKAKKLNESIEKDVNELNYLKEVESIANRMLNGACSPITKHTKEMQKALVINDMVTFNEHMKELFAVSLNKQQFDMLKLMMINAKRGGLDLMSNNQFKNLIMHIMTKRLVASGSFSPKKVKGALKKAIKDVPTISYEEVLSLDTSVVEKCIEMLGLSPKYQGDNYNYVEMKEKVIKALHTRIAVEPKQEQE